ASMIGASDAGIGTFAPHDAGRSAVAALTRTGMTPVEALRACTSRAAHACGLGDRKGRIAPGYDADILAVNGNPLDSPDALHRILSGLSSTTGTFVRTNSSVISLSATRAESSEHT